jgi:DNA-binding response OmpR family regulator
LKGKILVAEDHDTISETYKLMLEAEDYEITVTSNGDECIRKFDECLRATPQDSKSPYDLVILDYHLPGKDGIDIARHILSVCPLQRILFASSYPADVIKKSAASLPNSVELLIKPFDLNELVDVVTGQKGAETIGETKSESLDILNNIDTIQRIEINHK